MGQVVKQIEFDDDFLAEEEAIFDDFIKFAETYLTIETLEGDLVPFVLNNPQRRFIKEIIQQWQEIGLIDVVIVKARKMGFTTVITAFLYWVIYTNPMNKPVRRCIAGTHAKDANPTLLKIMRTFNNNMPKGMSLPTGKECMPPGKDNETTVEFPTVSGQYITQVASNVDDVGRSKTGIALHVSEIAHIDNSHGLAASLLSVVGINVPNTMIFLESTANGTDNYHYEVFIDALTGKDGCKTLPFFSAWWEDERYVEDPPEGFELTQDEKAEKERYKLTDKQMCWRRSTLSRFKGTPKQRLARFRQEYPGNWEEAFQFSKVESYIEPHLVVDAIGRALQPQDDHVAVVAAFDPSFKGKDRDAFGIRQGTNIFGIETPHFGEDFDARVEFLKRKLDNQVLCIDMLFVDYGGGGGQIVSRLHADGYRNVRAVEFGSLADDQKKAHLKCDEMAVCVNDALNNKHTPLCIQVSDEMKDELLKDMCAMGYKLDSDNRPKLESKESLKKRGVRSTDIWDMVRLLFASNIKRRRRQASARSTKAKTSYSPYVA